MSRAKTTADPKTPRPKSIAEARQIIRQTFKENRWDERDKKVYFEMLDVSGDVDEAGVRKIIEDLDKSKMVLFEDSGERIFQKGGGEEKGVR